MYISNNSNIGMATLLQQNKNCMKTLTTTSAATNGGNSIGVGGGGGVGAGCNSNNNNSNVISGVVGATGVSGGISTVLPQTTQTILLRNGATTVLTNGAIVLTNGASGYHSSATHIHHQQPKQLLHTYGASTLQQIRLQQQQQQQQPQKSSSNPSNSISTSATTSATAAITTTTVAATTSFCSVPNGNSSGGSGNTNNNNNDSNHVSTHQQSQLQQHQHVFATTAPGTAVDVVPVATDDQEPEPEIDIVINNVVCSFSVRCHLNLREIALNGFNVEYRRENGMVTMKLRRPYTTASIWSSGRITCTGATSEEQAKIAARRYSRCLEKLGFRVRFNNFRVVNVLGTCSMPWAIKIVNFSERYKKEASYEPELHPGVTYKLRVPKATLKIFSTGSITVTAASVANVQLAIEHIFPLVYEFRKKRSPEELEQLRLKQLHAHNRLSSHNPVVMDEVYSETITHSPPFVTTDADALDEVGANSNAATSATSTTACTKLLTVAAADKRPNANTDMLSNMKRKRKRLDNGGGSDADYDEDGLEIDDPEVIDENNIIVYSEFDDPDDLIEGPDDEDDDDL